MTAEVLEIPDDASEVPLWLERQMFSGNLGALVAQLEAVHQGAKRVREQTGDDSSTLDEVLGTSREAVSRRGLSALDHKQIGRLLVQPRLLLALQEMAFVDSADYWTLQARGLPESPQNAEEQRRRLWRHLTTPMATAIATGSRRADFARRDVL